jgi:hypothetical protein
MKPCPGKLPCHPDCSNRVYPSVSLGPGSSKIRTRTSQFGGFSGSTSTRHRHPRCVPASLGMDGCWRSTRMLLAEALPHT